MSPSSSRAPQRAGRREPGRGWKNYYPGASLVDVVAIEIAWYNGDGVNTIGSGSDYSVHLWDSLVSATS